MPTGDAFSEVQTAFDVPINKNAAWEKVYECSDKACGYLAKSKAEADRHWKCHHVAAPTRMDTASSPAVCVPVVVDDKVNLDGAEPILPPPKKRRTKVDNGGAEEHGVDEMIAPDTDSDVEGSAAWAHFRGEVSAPRPPLEGQAELAGLPQYSPTSPAPSLPCSRHSQSPAPLSPVSTCSAEPTCSVINHGDLARRLDQVFLQVVRVIILRLCSISLPFLLHFSIYASLCFIHVPFML